MANFDQTRSLSVSIVIFVRVSAGSGSEVCLICREAGVLADGDLPPLVRFLLKVWWRLKKKGLRPVLGSPHGEHTIHRVET
jgi:hypothetical protein